MTFSRIRLLMWKEFAQLRRDRMLLPLVFIQPILQLLMFGYVVGSDVTNIPTAIVDQDATAMSRRLEDSFSNSGYFVVRAHPSDEGAVRALMDGNRVQVAVLIPPGLQQRIERGEQVALQVVVDGVDSKIASVASGYAAQILGAFNQRLIDETGLAPHGAGIDARVRVLFNPTLRSVNAMIPGLVAFILMLSSSALVAQAVVRERERGTLEQMFVTPITRSEYMVGKVLPYILLAIVQIFAVMLVGIYWFRVPFDGSIPVIASGMALFMFTALGQGLFISTLSRTRHQAQQWTMFLMLPTVVLSGFIFPIESMPSAIVPVTYFIPLRYALIVLRANFMKGSGFDALWPQFAAMAGFSTVIFLSAVARFQKRLAD